jgi:hypothetical protein
MPPPDRLAAAAAEIPRCIFAAFLDLDLGAVRDADPGDFLGPSGDDALLASVISAFESAPMVEIEDLYRDAAGADDPLQPYFDEMIVLAANRVHGFRRMSHNPGQVACFVSDNGDPTETIEAMRRAFALVGSGEGS